MALKLKSNNSQGNPYHDEEGKFTSKGGEGTGGSEKKSDPLMDLFGSLGKSMRDSEAEEKEAMKLFGLKGDKEKTEEPKKKLWNVGTLDGNVFDEPIEAATEEEAYKIAEQMHPGYGDELEVSEQEGEEEIYQKMFDYFDDPKHKSYFLDFKGLKVPEHAIIERVFNPEKNVYEEKRSVESLKNWINKHGYTEKWEDVKERLKKDRENPNVLYTYEPREELRKWLEKEKGIDGESLSLEEEGYYYPQWLQSKGMLRGLNSVKSWVNSQHGDYIEDDKWFKGVNRYLNELKNKKYDSAKSESEQASKLFGMDLSDKKTWQVDVADPEMAQFLQLDYKGRNQAKKEGRLPKQFEKLDANTINSLMAGYNESVMDTPSTVSYTEHYGYDIGDYGTVDTGEEEKNIDVGIDDVVNYLKTQVTISPEDEELIRRDHVVPTRIMKEIFGDKASDEDLEEALADFLR